MKLKSNMELKRKGEASFTTLKMEPVILNFGDVFNLIPKKHPILLSSPSGFFFVLIFFIIYFIYFIYFILLLFILFY